MRLSQDQVGPCLGGTIVGVSAFIAGIWYGAGLLAAAVPGNPPPGWFLLGALVTAIAGGLGATYCAARLYIIYRVFGGWFN